MKTLWTLILVFFLCAPLAAQDQSARDLDDDASPRWFLTGYGGSFATETTESWHGSVPTRPSPIGARTTTNSTARSRSRPGAACTPG